MDRDDSVPGLSPSPAAPPSSAPWGGGIFNTHLVVALIFLAFFFAPTLYNVFRTDYHFSLKTQLIVPLAVAYAGSSVQFTFTSTSPCPHCHGSGAEAPSDVHVCPVCHGNGVELTYVTFGGRTLASRQPLCLRPAHAQLPALPRDRKDRLPREHAHDRRPHPPRRKDGRHGRRPPRGAQRRRHPLCPDR